MSRVNTAPSVMKCYEFCASEPDPNRLSPTSITQTLACDDCDCRLLWLTSVCDRFQTASAEQSVSFAAASCAARLGRDRHSHLLCRSLDGSAIGQQTRLHGGRQSGAVCSGKHTCLFTVQANTRDR